MTTTPTTTRLLDNYVGGRWTPSSSQEALPVTNPATGETLARVPLQCAPWPPATPCSPPR